jgi:outer membrane protein OmpA-like peptidoglycan-associated protein
MHVHRGRFVLALYVSCVLAALFSSAAFADDNHATPYLRLGAGARAFGMGGAFVGVADDATAGYWNPAGLTQVDDIALTFMGTGGYSYDRSHFYLGAAKSFSQLSIGLNWINAGWDGFQGRDALNNPTGEFDLSDNAILFSAARRYGMIAFGATGKIIDQKIADKSETGGGLDAGALVDLGERATLGVVFQDIWSEVGDDDLPINFRGGIAVNPFGDLTLASDLEKTEDNNDWTWHLGGEMWFEYYPGYLMAVRAGGDNIGRDESDASFAAGLGFKIPRWYGIGLDYAFVDEQRDFLGESHRFSLNLAFGERERDRDGDGIADVDDECPDSAEDYDGFEDEDGCPDADNDGDGIADVDDVCPDQAEDFDGFEDDDGCPETNDQDGDGVVDTRDKCPNEPEDLDNFQDDDGCPDLDNDGDGIADDIDKCPNQPETVNGFEDQDGCPDIAPRQVLKGVNFASGKADILPGSTSVLDEVAAILKADGSIRAEIQGHTDSQGAAGYNQDLSERRANSVREYLIQKGVNASQLTAKGYGESSPVADNSTEIGRLQNRRVELQRLDK